MWISKLLYALFVAACLIGAMRRAHEAQPEAEIGHLRVGSVGGLGVAGVAVSRIVA
jgi:hypothetical protein